MNGLQERPKPSSPHRSWRAVVRGNVLMMGMVSLLTDFSSEMINPILPIFFVGLVGGAKAALWVGLSEGIAEATAAILKIFSGRLSDKMHKRKALVAVGYGLSTLCRPAIALAAGAWQVMALKFGDRVGKGIRTSPRDALIGDSVGSDVRGLAFSFHRVMDHTGAILGPLVVAGLLFGILGYATGFKPSGNGEVTAEEMTAMRIVFGIALIPGLLAVATLLLKVREIAPARAPANRPGGTHGRSLPGRFYAFVGIVALFALGNSSDMFLLLYGWSLFQFGLIKLIGLWVLLHVAKIVFSIPGGVLSDRLGRRPVIVAGWVVYALVYIGMARIGPGQQWLFWTLFVAYGFFYGMTEGVEKALVTDFVPSAKRGTAFGIYHGAVGIAALPASLLFGVFWMEIGPRWAFGIAAGLAGVATLLLTALLSVGRP